MAKVRDYRAERLRRDEIAKAQGFTSYRQKRYRTQDKPAIQQAEQWKAYREAVPKKQRTPENAKQFLRDFGPKSGGRKYLRKESPFIRNVEARKYAPQDNSAIMEFYENKFDWDAWREQYDNI